MTSRCPGHRRFCVWLSVLLVGPTLGGPPETDEILGTLPNNFAGVLVIEDLADHLQLIEESPTFKQLVNTPVFKRWSQSPTYVTFQGLVTFLPAYFGISNDQLIADVLGESVVLAFRPGDGQSPPAGVFVCRAKDEQALTKVVSNLTQANANRSIERHEYQGRTFWHRAEFNGRQDYVLQMGAMAFLTDQKAVLEQIIDTADAGGGILDSPKFRAMRESAGTGAFLQLMIDTEPFQPLVNRSVDQLAGPERFFAKVFGDIWKNLDWAALTLHVGDHAELVLHTSVDIDGLDAVEKNWLELLGKPSPLWDRIPSDVVAAAAALIDMEDVGRRFHDLAGSVPEFDTLGVALRELIEGLDPAQEILPAVGPSVGFAVRIGGSGKVEVVAEVELRGADRQASTGLTLAQTIELVVLRPIMVFYSIDHNCQNHDTTRVRTTESAGLRLHAMTGSKLFPAWLEPAFAIAQDRLFFGSSADAIVRWVQGSASTWADSDEAKRFRDAVGERENPRAFVQISRLTEFMRSNGEQIAGEIADQAAVDVQRAEDRVSDLASILEPFHFATLSTSTEGSIRRWRLALFPK